MRRRSPAGPFLWVLVLGGTAVALQWSGRGALAAPPLASPGQWSAWLAGRDPVVAAFSLVRVVALAALWYLVCTTSVGLLLRLAGAARMVALADHLTVAPVRRLLAAVTLSLVATTAAGAAGPAAMAGQPAATTTLPTPPAAASAGAGPPATVTMHLLGPAEPAPPGPAEVAPAGTAPSPADRWTVQPGQCFWTIAESVLARAWGRPPTDAEIVPYWRRLVAANGSNLAHPGDPDLIFPGQVFQIPAP
jgi:hypothetical protein